MTAHKKRSRPRRRGAAKKHAPQHTSVPTSRNAFAETRRWLLEEHGPVCAYCGVKWPPRSITLDHVTPRKGQTAYDRRDNLVLACKRCNSAKADKSFLQYLLAQKARAVNLLHYGKHLSHGILDILRHMVGDEVPVVPAAPRKPRVRYNASHDDDADSPYA